MSNVKRNLKLQLFVDDVCKFISERGFEDKNESLILDYIDALDKNGIDLDTRDAEMEVYMFYHYHDKYNDFLIKKGEDKFIKLIVTEELTKNPELS